MLLGVATCSENFPQNTNPTPWQTYWWGGEPITTGRPSEYTPNLFSHELHHTTTLYAHGGADPCYTPSVGSPSPTCPRGLNMDLGPNSTVDAECLKVTNGIGGRDYTR
jgi:hypothetical protein